MMDSHQTPEDEPLDLSDVGDEVTGGVPARETIIIPSLRRNPLEWMLRQPRQIASRIRQYKWGEWMLRQPRQVAGAARQYKWVSIISAVVLVALLTTVVAVALANRPPNVHYAKVTQGNLTIAFAAPGTLRSATYEVNFSGSGKIAQINVSVGQQVTAGQTLATLDTTLLQDIVNQAQAAVNAAQSGLTDAQTNQENVQAQTSADLAVAYNTEQSAIASCLSKQSCIDQARNAYADAQAKATSENSAAQARVNAAQAQLSVAQAELRTAQDNLNGATLTAPHAGTIAAINGSVGSVVSNGSGAGTPNTFIQIADLSALQVLANVSTANIGKVAKGQTAHFTVPSLGSQAFHGSVDGVSPIGQTTGNTLTYPVTIDVDMQGVPSGRLLPGMSAEATIVTRQLFGVLLIPASAVNFARAAGDPKRSGFLRRSQVTSALGQARQNLLNLQMSATTDLSLQQPTPAYVLVRAKGKWVVKPVVLGLTNGASYEVLDGLKLNDQIATGQEGGPIAAPTATPSMAGNL